MRYAAPYWILLVLYAAMAPVSGPSHAQRPDPNPCESEPPPSSRQVAYPSPEYRDAQSALCAVQDGGTLVIGLGTYDEALAVPPDVEITIRGTRRGVSIPSFRQSEPDGFVPVEGFRDGRANPVVRVGAGARVGIEDLAFIGGDAGIFASEASIRVERTRFRSNSRGILAVGLGRDMEIKVSGATFVGQTHNAISLAGTLLAPCLVKVDINEFFLLQSSNVGVLIKDCSNEDFANPLIALTAGTIIQAQQGAILLVRSGPINLTNLNIWSSTTFGVAALGSIVTVAQSVVYDTLPDPVNGSFGDALISAVDPISVQPSNLTSSQNQLASPASAGIRNLGSHATLINTTIVGAPLSLTGDPLFGLIPTFDDLGGNSCDFMECVTKAAGQSVPVPANTAE